MMSIHSKIAELVQLFWPAIITHLWQATVFTLIALAVCLLLRRGPAKVRYLICLLALIKFLLPAALFTPIATQLPIDKIVDESKYSIALPLPAPPTPLLTFEPAPPTKSQSTNSVTTKTSTLQPARHSERYCLFMLIWLFGAVSLLALWRIRLRNFTTSLKNSIEPASERENAALMRARAQVGLNIPIKLSLSTEIIEPGVWGVLRPVIVLPTTIARELNDGELESMLTHECAHIKRRDNLFSNLQMLLCCLFWFHPLIWLLDRKLLADRELACDEMVLKLTGNAKDYASSLVKVFRFCLNWKVAGVSYAGGANMKRRIETIMANRHGSQIRWWHHIAATSFALLLVMASLITFTREHTSAQRSISKAEVKRVLQLAMNSDRLSEAEIAKLEKQLEVDPDNLDVRTQVLSYYYQAIFTKHEQAEKALKHARWLIEHHPEAAVTGTWLVMISALYDKKDNYDARGIWLKHVETHPNRDAVISNAVNYFQAFDLIDGEELLLRAEAMEPNNPEWALRLGQTYGSKIDVRYGDDRLKMASQAVMQLEKALVNTTEAGDQLDILLDLTPAAFKAGDFAKARVFANRLLEAADAYKQEGKGQYGDAVHIANTILGRCALRSDDIAGAKSYLLAAANTPGSEKLDTAGPNLALASELLEKGEKDVVLEYLKLSGKFWPTGKITLENWIAIVDNTGAISFGQR